MKKLTLAIAVLAIASISFFSFTKTGKGSDTAPEQQYDYVWIKYDCNGSVGTAMPRLVQGQPNYLYTNSSGYPALTGGFANCWSGINGSNCCAIRFNPGETEAVPGYPGSLRPKTGVSQWNPNRLYLWCN